MKSKKQKNTIDIKLTKLQNKHLGTLRWLISDEMADRASGRTFLLAVAFLEKAIKTGEKVYVFDHFRPGAYHSRRVLDTIVLLGGEKFLEIRLSDLSIKRL